MAKYGDLKDGLDFTLQVVAEGQQIAKQVAGDVAGLRTQLKALYDLQQQEYAAAGARRSADAAAAAARRKIADAAREQAAAEKAAAAAANEHRDALAGLGKQVLAAAAAFYAFQGFRLFISEGLQFNQTIETANLGIASLITAQAELRDANGQLLTGTDKLRAGQALAEDQVNKLRIAGLQTTATTQELVVAFQQAVGVGLRWGLTLDQIRKLTIQMSQAAGALGLPMNQLNEEVRDLLGGNINARNTRIATALGITNEQIREAQRAGKLFDFVTGKLQAFSVAGEATAQSFAGTTSNIKEALQNFSGDATKPLFDAIKVSGQQALNEVFDLSNARISANFSGLLEFFQSIFKEIGAGLSSAIEGGIEKAKELSNWLKENKADVMGVVAASELLSSELGATLADVIGLIIPLGEVGVKAGVIKTILVGAGVAVAGIHEVFQQLTVILGFIGNLILIALVGPFVGWLKIIARAVSLFNEDLGQSIDNAAEKGLDFLSKNAKGLAEYADGLMNGGFAIDKYIERLRYMEAKANAATHAQKELAKASAGVGGITLKSTANTAKPGNQSAEAQGSILLAKGDMERELKDLKILLDSAQISYADYYAKRTVAQQTFIDKQIAAEEKLLSFTTDEGKKQKILDTITNLQRQRTQVVEDNNAAQVLSYQKLEDEVAKAQVQLLKATGRSAEANALEIETKYRLLIARLKANGKEAGAAIVQQLFDVESAKGRIDEINRAAKVITDQLQLDLTGIQQRVKLGNLTEQQGIEQTATAYARAKAGLLDLLPELERAAAITGDPTQIAAVEQLRQKITQMGIQVTELTDTFRKLKDGARDSLQDGLATFLDQAIEGAKSLHDIWIDVARGIVAQLRKIASQMLANLIIQKALGFFGSLAGGVSSGTGEGLQIAGEAGPTLAAGGGYITGPGTATSDSIPAYLSNGEFVMQAAAVRHLGVDFLHDLNNSASPGAVRRSRSRGYAEGGLVTASGGQATGGFDATIGLEEGLVARHIRTKSGTRAILNVIAENRKTISGMIGPGGR
jgi:hypothetical protein